VHYPSQSEIQEYWSKLRWPKTESLFTRCLRANKEVCRKVYADGRKHWLIIWARSVPKTGRVGISDNTSWSLWPIMVHNQRPYVAGLKGLKGHVSQWWSQSPFFIRFLQLSKEIEKSKTLTHTIDVMPYSRRACGFDSTKRSKKEALACFHWFREMRISRPDRSIFLFLLDSENILSDMKIFPSKRSGWNSLGRTSFDSGYWGDFELLQILWRRIPMSFRILLLSGGKTSQKGFWELKIRIRWDFS